MSLAIDLLEESIDAGFDASDYLYKDEDLRSLRGDRRFLQLREEHGNTGRVNRATWLAYRPSRQLELSLKLLQQDQLTTV